jgi:hypothetical protein
MPFSPLPSGIPVFWNLWGHSYMQHGFGPRSQSGRIDAFIRARVPVSYGDFANFAVTGARLSVEGQSQGGYARVINNLTQTTFSTGASGPAVSEGGAHLFIYGINDLGNNGQTAQYNAAYGHAARTCISRARMSWLRQNNYAGAAGTGVLTYGAGFINFAVTGEFTTGLTARIETASGTTPATGSTVTFTLPSDYQGETIASLWIANPGVAGGTITITGTAVASTVYNNATFSTSNIMPSASLNHSPVCHRIKGLTAANAGQTIIYTVTASDSAAAVTFDSIWGEALDPPPVIWGNTARLTTAGYALYATGIGDADVAIFNAVMPPIIAEFDSMVQLADVDGAISKDPVALIYDGLHPNELGAARVADAVYDALSLCNAPTSAYGLTANMQSPGPRYGQEMKPHFPGWHTADSGKGPSTGAAAPPDYTPLAGDMFALPFFITSGLRRINNWSIEAVSASTTAAPSVWFAIYDDRRYTGYPQVKYVDTTSSALTLTSLSAVVNVSAASGNGSIGQPIDPGLYWLVIQVASLNSGTPGRWRTLGGPSPYMPNMSTTGGAFAASSSPMGWKLTGQASAVLPKTFPAGALRIDNVPMIGLNLASVG